MMTTPTRSVLDTLTRMQLVRVAVTHDSPNTLRVIATHEERAPALKAQIALLRSHAAAQPQLTSHLAEVTDLPLWELLFIRPLSSPASEAGDADWELFDYGRLLPSAARSASRYA